MIRDALPVRKSGKWKWPADADAKLEEAASVAVLWIVVECTFVQFQAGDRHKHLPSMPVRLLQLLL
jgi:hypothetical protein